MNNDSTQLADELASLHAKIDALSAKQATVHLRLGVILLAFSMFAVACYFGYRQVMVWRGELKHAEQIEAQWKVDEQKIADLEKQNATANKADTAKQQVITKVVHVRDKDAASKISEVTKQPRAIEDIVADVHTYLKANPIITPQKQIAFEPPVVQGFISTQIDHDRLLQNVNDAQSLYTLEQQKTGRLTADNTNLRSMLNECSDTVAAYKNVAKKSGWHKFLDGTKKGLEIAAGGLIGYEIGHAL